MSGGEAKNLVADGLVRVNGEPESRKRRQMARGDVVDLDLEMHRTSHHCLLRRSAPGGPVVVLRA